MKKNITIIGGGLCGLSLANGLRLADVPVEVFEAGRYPRHRVCGEFITSLSSKAISTLGLESCFQDALLHESTNWYNNGKLINHYRLPEPAMGISRYLLDQRMATLLENRGGRIHQRHRIRETSSEGVIHAGGRRAKAGGFIGLKGHWSELDTGADLDLHIGNFGYVGLSKVESGFTNVCGLFKSLAKGHYSTPVQRFYATLELHGLGDLAERIRLASYRPSSLCSITGLHYDSQEHTSMSLGDHDRQIPPFTGNGMTIAIESSARVLPMLIDYSHGFVSWQDFKQESRRILDDQLNRRYYFANKLHPFLLNPVSKSILTVASQSRLLPFRTIYSLTHN